MLQIKRIEGGLLVSPITSFAKHAVDDILLDLTGDCREAADNDLLLWFSVIGNGSLLPKSMGGPLVASNWAHQDQLPL